MKKNIKKIMSLILTVAVFFGLTNIAQADLTSSSKGQITVSGVEDTVNVSAYRLMNVFYDDETQQPVDPVFAWVNEVQPWITENYPQFTNATEFNTKYIEDHTEFSVDEFYDKLAAAIAGGDINLTPATRTGAGAIDNLTMGNYLILIENGLKVYRPSAVNLIPSWNDDTNSWEMTSPAVVKVKSSSPSIEKKADGSDKITNQIGGKVPFEIKSDVLVFPKNAKSKVYNISDELPTALTLNNSSIKVYGVTAANEAQELTAGTHYTLTTENNGFKVVFNYDNLHDDENKTYTKVKINYEATVNANAVVGSPITNNAKLEYTKNPYRVDSTYEETTSSASVYTYGLNVKKVGDKAEHINGLPGAEFILNTNETNKENPFTFVSVGEGEYRVSLDTDTDTVTTLATDENGVLKISGLDANTYYLWETKAPGGYNKPSKPVKVIIEDSDINGKPEYQNEGNSVEAEDGYVPVEIKNTSGFLLPETGGIGTIIFTALGVILMGVSIILFVKTRKNEQ